MVLAAPGPLLTILSQMVDRGLIDQPPRHALAARITLTVQKELQMLAVQTGVSAGQLRAAASASQVAASGALIQDPSPMTMISEDEE
jgi:hypothetical protein